MKRLIEVFDDRAASLTAKLVAIYVLLLCLNGAAWLWAIASFRSYPVLLGTALLAYTFGLRHAVDADHIAAIDNVTRKLIQEGKRPAGVGLFFSLGHSTVVVLASVAIAAGATAFKDRLESVHAIGGIVGTTFSASFLLILALLNLVILRHVYRTFLHVKAGGDYVEDDLNVLLAKGGVMARLLGPVFRLVRSSWHMYPLGILFGLGFDTATEVGILGLSAAEASKGLPLWSILVFPALFTAGMTLIDTTDSVLMLGAYGWAFVKPIRKLYYNLTITLVSVLIALAVGGAEVLGLVRDQLRLEGPFWGAVGDLNDHFGTIGYSIILIFVMSWIVSIIVYRAKGYDKLEAGSAVTPGVVAR